jgi:hypothetical protein
MKYGRGRKYKRRRSDRGNLVPETKNKKGERVGGSEVKISHCASKPELVGKKAIYLGRFWRDSNKRYRGPVNYWPEVMAKFRAEDGTILWSQDFLYLDPIKK